MSTNTKVQSIHDRVQSLFADERTNDAARTLDLEYSQRIEEYTRMWQDGLLATYEYVNWVMEMGSRP